MSDGNSITAGQFAQFISILWSVLKDMTSETAQRLLDSPKHLAAFLSDALFGQNFTVTIDYNRAVNYGKVEQCNSKSLTFLHVRIIRFVGWVRPEQALAEMKRQNLRPATSLELQAMGESHENLPRFVIALGSPQIDGNRKYYTSLRGTAWGRHLEARCDFPWSDMAFAAVQE